MNDAEPLIWTLYRANDEFPLGVVLKFQQHTLQTFFLNTDPLNSQ